MTDISKNVQTLIKKAYHVPSTYHNTKWYNETSHIYQNTFEANDINVQTVPTTPVWLDVSSSESSLYELGIAITTSDSFAVTDASFIETISGDVYYDDYQKSPGAYIDSTGTVMLFVRLKLDKMITDSENSDYGVDTNAIAYVKYGASNLILNGSFEEGATDVNGYEFSSATGGVPNWTTDVSDRVVFIEDGNNAWSSGDDVVATYDDDWLIGLQYKDTSISQTVGNLEAGSYNISFAVAARNHVYTTSPFLFEVKNANSGEILVDLSDTSVIAWTYKTFSFDITSHNTDITVTFTNNHSIAYDNDDNDDDDRTVFFDSVELKKQTPCSILSNSYQYNYNTQLDVSGVSDTISVFKPYNYKLEYSEDSGNTFLTSLANSVGNWAFDFKSGIVTFGNDPSDDVPSIDISNGDLYFTFVKYVGLRGVNNLDTINGDLTVGGGAIIGAPTGSTTVLAGAGGLDGMGGNQGTATASSTPNTGNGRYAYSPFNNDLSGEWWSTSLGKADEDSDYAYGYYEYLNFEFPYDVYVTNYKIWRRDADTSDNPYEWILYGSTHDESDNFIVIDEQTDVAAMYGKYDNDVTTANDNDEYQEYTVATTPAAYRHIRMVISQSNHSVGASNCIVSIGELGLYGFVAVTLNVLGGANITSDLTVGGVFTPSNISTNNTTLVIGNKNGTGEATPPYSYSWAEFQTSKLALGGYIIELRTGSDGDGITGGITVMLEDSLMTVTGAANISSDLTVGGNLVIGASSTNVETAISTAQNTANSAESAASAAQSTANSAESAASAAQSTANSAASAASAAQSTANSAASAASAAQSTANSKQDVIDSSSDIDLKQLSINSTFTVRTPESGTDLTDGFIATFYKKDDDKGIVLYRKDGDMDAGAICFQPPTDKWYDCFVGKDHSDMYIMNGNDGSDDINIGCTGNVNTSASVQSLSDNRLKHNEIELTNSLESIRQLKCVKYFKTRDMYEPNYNFELNNDGLPLDESGNVFTDYRIEIGLVAQDVYEIEELKDCVNPNLTNKRIFPNNRLKPWTVDYNSIHIHNISALQEVDRQLVAEKEKTATLETEVATLKNQVSTFETQMSELLARVSSLESNNSTTTDGS